MAIISDRHSSIAKACKNVVPWATQGICYYHLLQNIITHFRAKDLMHLVRGATYAYTVADYDRNMAQLHIAHPDLADYLENADPRLWARVHFPGNRFTLLTSNIAESINSMFKNAKEFPVSYLLEFIRERLGLWFWKRREDAIGLTTQLSRGVEALLTIRSERADTMVVDRIATWIFHVVDRKRDFTVDLEARKCSCGLYTAEMIPCSHALAAITEAGMHMSSFIESTYSRNSLYSTYSVNIYPKGESWKNEINEPLAPPEVRPLPGRRKKSRWQTTLELSRRRNPKPRKRTKHYNCSKCKQPGHTRPFCVAKDEA